jgi:hypothetical protein
MEVATNALDVWIELPSREWNMKLPIDPDLHNSLQSMLQSGMFPSKLKKQKYMDQLRKVYDACISPSQYLPVLFTEDRYQYLLECGLHISEKVHPLKWYSGFQHKYQTEDGSTSEGMHYMYISTC